MSKVESVIDPSSQGEGVLKARIQGTLAVVFILGSVSAWPTTECHAQAADSRSAQPTPSDSELDALLEAKNWGAIYQALARAASQEDFLREIGWLRKKVASGGGLIPSVILSRTLWAVGTKLNLTDPKQDPRMSSALLSLYILTLLVVDGEKCDDQSAPVEHIQKEVAGNAATLKFLKQQSVEIKTSLVDTALGM
jgi:hypothetical protein